MTACAADCSDNLCAHTPATAACMTCVATIVGGCGNQLTACNDDF